MLHGQCSKDGYAVANVFLSAESDNVSLAGMMVPYVGIAELAVDSSSGATSKYPDSYTVRMRPAGEASAEFQSAPPATGTAAPAKASGS